MPCQAFEFNHNMQKCWLHDGFKGYIDAPGWHSGRKTTVGEVKPKGLTETQEHARYAEESNVEQEAFGKKKLRLSGKQDERVATTRGKPPNNNIALDGELMSADTKLRTVDECRDACVVKRG